jgi:hypothetical protein
MQPFLSSLKQGLRKGILAVMLTGLISALGCFMVAIQPSYALPNSSPLFSGIEEKTVSDYGKMQSPGEPTAKPREAQYASESYEELTEEMQQPKAGMQEEYKKNLQTFRESDEGNGLVNRAKEAIGNLTGNE